MNYEEGWLFKRQYRCHLRVYCYVVIKQAIREKALGNRVKIGEKKKQRETHLESEWQNRKDERRLYNTHTSISVHIIHAMCDQSKVRT